MKIFWKNKKIHSLFKEHLNYEIILINIFKFKKLILKDNNNIFENCLIYLKKNVDIFIYIINKISFVIFGKNEIYKLFLNYFKKIKQNDNEINYLNDIENNNNLILKNLKSLNIYKNKIFKNFLINSKKLKNKNFIQILNAIDKLYHQIIVPKINTFIKNKDLNSNKKLKLNTFTNILNQKSYKYYLVLDLDETLVHFKYEDGLGKFFIRPYAIQFIEEISKYYELILFTASLEEYCNVIMPKIDPNNKIKKRFYRNSCVITDKYHLKDLELITKNLKKIIIIDNNKNNFQKHKQNGIKIKSWYEDKNDNELKKISNFLKKLIERKVPDVRLEIPKILEILN